MKTTTKLDEILERLRSTQQELEQEIESLLAEKRKKFQYSLRRGKVIFELNVRNWQRQQRTTIREFLYKAPLTFILSAPVIYGMIIPLIILDLSISFYQYICFRIYGIPLVCRADYLIIDRQHLAYLNVIEKFNCVYCGYGNGLIEFAREVIARTEQYWCPIKHAHRTLDPHRRTQKFVDYGDVDAWLNNLEAVRQDFTEEPKK
jgi:hypothetical protein